MTAFINMFVATAFVLVLLGINQTSATGGHVATGYGMPCNNNLACIGANLICEYNQCVCRHGYFDVEDGLFVKCVPPTPPPPTAPPPKFFIAVFNSGAMVQPAIAMLVAALFALVY